MPEEKKKDSKTGAIFFGSKKETKRDSFTFSDKIKNSKPAGSKSFANRVSSKVGSDGKPKKTLFERTRRDAPFFIAAIVALLLLPFLYKYSGQVAEEPMVTPGSEESVFDPERYGFDTVTGDPDGQIAQLSGRDPLSLIKGLNSEDATTEDSSRYDADWTDRNGMDDSASASTSNNNTEVEENNTNIYKRRAPAATRAAFRRAATKINNLPNAGLNSRGGGKLGVGMWGGGMKTAAKRVSAPAQRTSPKPVSLQPLQAAGKPSRSYFGQGAAAEARRSKDALSKGNAMQALADAQMKPIDPGKIGGLGGGAFGPGGGNGKMDRNFTFQGKEPWWWDMMKTRAQKEWEAKFNRKWDWIKWQDKLLQNILGGVLNCLITGEDDGSMGSMFGSVEGAGAQAKCGELTEDLWKKCSECTKYGEFGKKTCKAYLSTLQPDSSMVKKGWQGGGADVTLGPISKRLDCLSNGLGAAFSGLWNKWFGKEKGSLTEASDCTKVAIDGLYRAEYNANKEKKRTIYTYVVGIPVKDLPVYYSGKLQPEQQREKLVIGLFKQGAELNLNNVNRAGFVPLFVESVAIKNRKQKKTTTSEVDRRDSTITQPGTDDNDEDGFSDSEMAALFANNKGQYVTYDAFLDKLRRGGAVIVDDYADYNQKFGGTPETKQMQLQFSAKKGKRGKGWILGARCPYPLARISCDNYANAYRGKADKDGYPYAHLTFANGMANSKVYDQLKNQFMVSYAVQGKDNTLPTAITTSTDAATGQWFPVPHFDIRPFTGSWNQESMSYSSKSLGTERASKDLVKGYQVVAKSKTVEQLRGTGDTKGDNRVVVTWEVRQCYGEEKSDQEVDGSTINDGGCHKGLVANLDKDGNVTGYKGQSRPGVVVSTATCIYEDGSEPIGFPVDLDNQNGTGDENVNQCKGENDWKTTEECCVSQKGAEGYKWINGQCVRPPQQNGNDNGNGNNQPVERTLTFAKKMNGTDGISDRYNKQRPGLVELPTFNVYGKGGERPLNQALDNGDTCLQVGSGRHMTKRNPAKMFNQEASKAYVDRVVKDTNGSAKFTAQNTKFVHDGTVYVAELVDAMTVAYAQNPNAQVPLEVVCSLGKTIAYNSFDPQMRKINEAWRNTFGAFSAYIGPDSSYYPAPWTSNQGKTIVDKRFVGCNQVKVPDTNPAKYYPRRGASISGVSEVALRDSVRPYHYGNYNWDKKDTGDMANILQYSGSTGRDAYLKHLTDNGWSRDGFNPKAYPLHAIAEAINFKRDDHITDQGLVQNTTNMWLDDHNRLLYDQAYINLFNDADTPCYLTGEMPVREALEYVGAVCTNSRAAKPKHGRPGDSCGTVGKVSSRRTHQGGDREVDESSEN